MAVCTDCNQEMMLSRSCTRTAIELVDGWYQRITYGSKDKRVPVLWRKNCPDRCGDCGTRLGGYHHLGCDCECCPRCGGQLFICECHGDEDELEDADWSEKN